MTQGPVTLFAPCKINLYLEVLGKRSEDGYHELVMVMVPTETGDEITLSLTETRGVEITCSHPGVPVDSSNLVHKAVREFERQRGSAEITLGVRCDIRKHSPVAGGVGGGSSDAASALMGVNELLGRPLNEQQLFEAAARVGADVPFFLDAGPSLVEGVGDELTPIAGMPPFPVLLVNPGKPLGTAEVYRGLGLQPEPRAQIVARKDRKKIAAMTRGMCTDPAAWLRNDLERVSIPLLPEIAVIRKALLDAGARAAMMSGSGPTVFGLFDSDDGVRSAHEALGRTHPGWALYPTRTAGS